MSLFGALVFGQGAVSALAAQPLPDSTWVALAPLGERSGTPILAIAASPTDPATVLVGSGSGVIYRSSDAGASWAIVARGVGKGVLTIQFNPFKPGLVYAGSRGEGLWRSLDSGGTWAHTPGMGNLSVRSIGFSRSMTLVGGDNGLLGSRDGVAWTPYPRLSAVSLSSLAISSAGEPPRLLAGGDGSRGNEALPLFVSPDAGTNWNPVKALGSSTMVAAAAAGPAPAKVDSRPVVVGTNAGAFLTSDGGANWAQLSGLPGVDFSAAAFTAAHPDRFYLASDGGGTEAGGLWATSDSGQNFRSLLVPVGSVTALSVSTEEQPTIYAATMRPVDHAVMLWAYHDTGGRPLGPAGGVPPASQPRPAAHLAAAPARFDWHRILTGPEAPFVGAGAVSLMVLLVALAMHLGRGRE